MTKDFNENFVKMISNTCSMYKCAVMEKFNSSESTLLTPEEMQGPPRTKLNPYSPAWDAPILEEGEQENHLFQPLLLELQDAQDDGCVLKTAEAWNGLGLIRLHTRQNPRGALECHQMALGLLLAMKGNKMTAAESKNKAVLELLTITTNDIGLCFERLSEHTNALESYQESLRYMKQDPTIFPPSHPRFHSMERTLTRMGHS